jgi:hypothetical protein
MSNNLSDWQHRQHKQDKALLLIIKLVALLVFVMVCALFYEIAKAKTNPNIPPVPVEFQTPEQAFQRQIEKQKAATGEPKPEEKPRTELETLHEVEQLKNEELGDYQIKNEEEAEQVADP